MDGSNHTAKIYSTEGMANVLKSGSMDSEDLFYLEILKRELYRRKELNPLYSLRAFALNLDMDPSLLSKIMNEKLLPTLETADKLCRKLKLSSAEAKEFMKSIADEKTCLELQKLNPDYTDCE